MGIKGVGMASLAVISKEAGFIVGGSDVEDEFITDNILKEKGIEILIGFDPKNPEDFFGSTPASECLMIITGAHGGFDNIEVESIMGTTGETSRIKVITHGEAVGLFMSGELFERSDIEGISVSGSHGKTTISAMLATFLTKLGMNPTYTIGTSDINPIGAAGHFGTGKYFVAEADEYMSAPTIKTPKFLYQYPKYLIINNIDFDHPDFFADIEAVKNAFGQLIENLDSNGILIVNGDDENVREIIKGIKSTTGDDEKIRVITYGTGEGNEFRISDFVQEGFNSHFAVSRENVLLGEFELSVPGFHNAKNVLACIALLIELGVSAAEIEKTLPSFKGSKRRMELIGKTELGVEIIDDYAHHPEEIRKTLEAFKKAYPDKKITVVFQAHTFGRTKALESEFVSAFAGVNELIIFPTFASARSESLRSSVSGQARSESLQGSYDRTQVSIVDELRDDRLFVEKIRALNPNVKLIEKRDDVVKYLSGIGSDSVIMTMGAGDVYKVGEKLISK